VAAMDALHLAPSGQTTQKLDSTPKHLDREEEGIEDSSGSCGRSRSLAHLGLANFT
jgi:hypothetical protein